MKHLVISDLHLDHRNIIEYCNRPFDSLDEMNETMVSRWNEAVDQEDKVLFLGDLAMADGETAIEWAEQLNGQLMFVDGNHDDIADAPFPIYEAYVIQHGKYRFYCTHRPENVPEGWNDWVLYGHHHNNDLRAYPFVDPQRNRVNVSVELLDYRPIQMDELVRILDGKQRYRTLEAALADRK